MTQPLSFSLPTNTEIEFTRNFEALSGLVFDAMTTCEHMPNWMTGPEGWIMNLCEVNLRFAGQCRWGWQKGESGASMQIIGVYQEVGRPNRVVHTENWGEPWPEALNTLELTEGHGKTSMNLTVRYPSKADRDAALETGMMDGMSMSYDRLDQILARKNGS